LGCEGISTIKGVSRLADKESNRANSLQEVFQQLGVTIRIEEDCMFISGPVKVSKGRVSSHGDHRIAMAVATAALNGTGTVDISGAEAVNKSFPDFFSTLSSLGASVSLSNQ
jgi:3-phosphoshikimate 1-carboxyvinyltransferase